ncbi:MAG: outer membrane beta-barrel protein [Candidatus Azobacteroides sp.]|nr:outer membrane beta-barrel protein [Candidatus Azobacteroides sp.]
MKTRIIFTFFFVTTLTTSAFSQIKVTGKVTDNKNAPLEFANVVLQAADTLFGAYSDENGIFELQAVPGTDTLKISMLGYKPYEQLISLQTNIDLGEIRLEDMAVELKEAVVTGRRITRMSDRFVMNLANDPTVFGKDGLNVLNTAPGVFILERDGTVSVNGKTGTQVYVNERPLHYSGTDLVRYLQNLKAEDIVKIEVLPNAGSEYDASVTGGIIKITLKNRRDDGIDGNVGTSYSFAPDGEDLSTFSPFLNVNYRINKLSLYTQLNYNNLHTLERVVTDANTYSINQNVHSAFDLPQPIGVGNVKLGGIYDLSERQSVGLEVNYSNLSDKFKSFGDLTSTTGGNRTDIASNYQGKITTDNFSVSGNYLLRLDSLGSMFKILLDYFHNKLDNSEDYHAQYSGAVNIDSIYRSDILTKNNTYAATVDFAHQFDEQTKLSVGAKYARNEMNNNTLYEYLQATVWNNIEPLSSVNTFTENVSALYGMFSSRIQKVSYSLGLRGEYTKANPWTNQTDAIEKQSYFKLFPSVNVMLPFGTNGKHSIVWNYHRTITRPSFQQLNPFRIASTEYLCIAGNPKLQPALADDGSVALNLFYKYNLTAGVTNTKNAFGNVFVSDPDTQGMIIKTVDNVTRNTNWYLSINGSVNITKWWQMYLTTTGKISSIEIFGEKRSINAFSFYMNHTFSLPKDFKLDINGYYQSPWLDGNTKYKMDLIANATLRKQLLKNKLTATVFVNNIFGRNNGTVETNENDFSQVLKSSYGNRMIGASLSYNFQSGKKVSDKKVETGAAEEKARLR